MVLKEALGAVRHARECVFPSPRAAARRSYDCMWSLCVSDWVSLTVAHVTLCARVPPLRSRTAGLAAHEVL